MAKVQAVTSIPRSPDDDRTSRMIRYSIGWGIRLVCLISLLFLHGWWLVVPAIIAIGAPMVLVVLANAVGTTRKKVERPGAIVRSSDSDR
ncbi:MAG: DUF3099 domain-containing protein [Actinomycetota bacterium]